MEISIKPEIIGSLFGIPISNSLILSFLTACVLLGGGMLGVRSLRLIPYRLQNMVEALLGAILDFITQTLGSRKQAMKFFPLVATLFLFILFNNWLGILPGIGSIGAEEYHGGEKVFVPFFRSAASDLNTTLALAVIAMVMIQWEGIRKLGLAKHLSKFIVLSKGPLNFFVGILELITEFAKVLSFSFRLFGNIFAGEVLLLIMMTLAPFVIPLPFLALELFVGFVQALVFAMLTLIFLKIATETVEH